MLDKKLNRAVMGVRTSQTKAMIPPSWLLKAEEEDEPVEGRTRTVAEGTRPRVRRLAVRSSLSNCRLGNVVDRENFEKPSFISVSTYL